MTPVHEEKETDGSHVVANEPSEAESRQLLLWLMFALVVILAGALWRKSRQDKGWKHIVDEKSTFKNLQKACKSNQAGETHSAIYVWLACCPPISGAGSRPATLGVFAQIMKDNQLAREFEELQQAMISAPANWNGDALLISLKRIRHRINTQKIVQSRNFLAPLNP